MIVTRTFHPVGQGAFFSESFYAEEGQEAFFNLAYDCGSTAGYVSKAKMVVRESFNNSDQETILVISHIDSDHVSLIPELLKLTKISRIILPYTTKDAFSFVIIMSKFENLPRAERLLKAFYSIAYDDQAYLAEKEPFDDLPQLCFVCDKGQKDELSSNVITIQSGDDLVTIKPVSSKWRFVPRNYDTSNEYLFSQKLEELYNANHTFHQIVDSNDVNINDIAKAFSNTNFTHSLLCDSHLKSSIRDIYKSIPGGINSNSLILLSVPMVECSSLSEVPYGQTDPSVFMSGCLYTGDSDCNLTAWQTAFKSYWGKVGTIQLPHHGSIRSFSKHNNLPFLKDHKYIFPVSCGERNRYGHPSNKVLSILSSNDCPCHIVTENASSVYIQRLVIE